MVLLVVVLAGGGVVLVLVGVLVVLRVVLLVVVVVVVVLVADLDRVGSVVLADAASAAPSVCFPLHGAPIIQAANTSRPAATTPSAVGIPHDREECARCRPAIAFLEFQ